MEASELREVRALLGELRRPATTAHIKRFKEAYNTFNMAQDIAALIAQLDDIIEISSPPLTTIDSSHQQLTREDLRLICFDHIVG